MLVFPRLSHHSLTGRLVVHRSTSYAALVFLMLGVGLMLTSVTWPTRADTCGGVGFTSCQGSYVVAAVVPPPRPSQPAIITSPTTGQSFATNPVTVVGTCPAGAIIKVFSNGIVVGSVICGAN